MHKLASSFLLLLFAALAAVFGLHLDTPPEKVAAKDHVVVTRIIDGDTVEVLDGTKKEKLRQTYYFQTNVTKKESIKKALKKQNVNLILY